MKKALIFACIFISIEIQAEQIDRQVSESHEEGLILNDGAATGILGGLRDQLSGWFSKGQVPCAEMGKIYAEGGHESFEKELSKFIKEEKERCNKKLLFVKSCLEEVEKSEADLRSCVLKVPEAPIAPQAPSPAEVASYQSIKAQIQRNKDLRSNLAKDESREDPNARSLLILLDDSEIISQSIPFTRRAIAAIIQKAGPILITASLLTHVFNYPDTGDPETKALAKIFHDQFDPDEWAVWRLGEGGAFFLLLPSPERKLSSKKLGIELEKSALLNITPVVKKTKGTFKQYTKDLYEKYKKEANDKKLSAKFIDMFKGLFVPKKDYKDPDSLPNWVIQLGGHGEINDTIAGISVKGNPSEFQMFLDVIDKQISVKILAYISCYAAALNAKQTYGDLMSKTGVRTYSFPIATEAITDASTIVGEIKAEGGKLKTEIKYDEFVKAAKREPIDFIKSLGHIFPLVNRPPSILYELAGIPQLRPANTPAWFPVSENKQAVIRIGRVEALTRDEPLIVKPYIDAFGNKKDPKAILLATDKVPFKIIIDKSIEIMPPLISITPGSSFHELAYLEIRASDFNMVKIMGEIEYGAKRLFWIKRMVDSNKSINLRDVVVETIETSIKAYGTNEHDGKPLALFVGQAIPPNYIAHYKAMSEKMGIRRQKDPVVIDLEKRDSLGLTPLMRAAQMSDGPGVELLLKAGADVNARNIRGLKAIDYANAPEIKKIILEAMKEREKEEVKEKAQPQ